MTIKNTVMNILTVALATMVITGTGYVFAAPTSPPEDGSGVYAPLNVGPDAQTKEGDLTVSGSLSTGELCVGGECQTGLSSGVQAGTVFEAVNGEYVGTCDPYYDRDGYGTNPITGDTYSYFCTIDVSYRLPISPPEGVVVSINAHQFECQTGDYVEANYYNPEPYFDEGDYNYSPHNMNISLDTQNNEVVFTGECRMWEDLYGYDNYDMAIDVSAEATYIY